MAMKLHLKTQQKFAQGVAEGMSATRAYMAARPDANLTPGYAAKEASGLLRQGKISGMVEHYRKALIDNATDEFILNRNEIRRALTLAVVTPVSELEKEGNEWLVQEKTVTDGPNGTTTKIKGLPKLGALQELAKLDGHYEAEKAPVQSMARYDDEYIQRQLAASPEFQEYLREEAALEAARLGRVIEIAAIEVPPPRRSQEELEVGLTEDEEYEKMMREEETL